MHQTLPSPSYLDYQALVRRPRLNRQPRKNRSHKLVPAGSGKVWRVHGQAS